jgi:two-component system phosphate regulon sensor histidine kinase PhoR
MTIRSLRTWFRGDRKLLWIALFCIALPSLVLAGFGLAYVREAERTLWLQQRERQEGTGRGLARWCEDLLGQMEERVLFLSQNAPGERTLRELTHDPSLPFLGIFHFEITPEGERILYPPSPDLARIPPPGRSIEVLEPDPSETSGKLEEAIEHYRQALQTLPMESDARATLLHALGRCHRKLGRPAEAIGYYREVLTRFPDAWHPSGWHLGLSSAGQLLLIPEADPGESIRSFLNLLEKQLPALDRPQRLFYRNLLQKTLPDFPETVPYLESTARIEQAFREAAGRDRFYRQLERLLPMTLPEDPREKWIRLLRKAAPDEEELSLHLYLRPDGHGWGFAGDRNRIGLTLLKAARENHAPLELLPLFPPIPPSLPPARTDRPWPLLVSLPPVLGWKARLNPPLEAELSRFLTSGKQLLVLGVYALCAVIAAGLWTAGRMVRREIRSARVRTELASRISHELKTPLTAIRMFVDTLYHKRFHSADEERACLETISRESLRLERTVRKVLGFARMESPHRQFSFRTFPLLPMLEETMTLVRPLFQEKGSRVILDTEGEATPDLSLRGDRDALMEVFLNLLSNAAKYAPAETETRLRVRSHPREARISVSDQGPGIPRSEQHRIFEPFYRSGLTKEDLPPGTGLGLAIARHTVREHGGKLLVDSETGKGSTFTACLPRLDSAEN